jgi:hypothetical protein
MHPAAGQQDESAAVLDQQDAAVKLDDDGGALSFHVCLHVLSVCPGDWSGCPSARPPRKSRTVAHFRRQV